jgi:hypothetical protein
MASLINNSTGNFTTAATWSLIDSTSFSNSETNNTASTTSWVASQTFVPGAITVDGIAIKVLSHTAVGNVGVKLGKNGSITAISVANPTHVTSNNHGLVSGEAILIAGTNSTPALVGPYTVTVLDGNTFTVPVNVTIAGTAGTWITVLANIASNTLVAAPVFTTTVAHGLTVGTQITIRGSTSSPSMNGTWTIATTPLATTFTLTGAPSMVGGTSGLGFYNIVGVSDTLVVIAANDMQTVNTGTNNGWTFFKFPSSVTLTASTSYSVQMSGTTAGNITPYRTATAGDWSRALRTTTTQAPASGDNLFVAGDFSSVGSNNSYTVTNDNTATTQWGDIEVAGKGTLAYGTAASTNYYLKVNNSPTIYAGGTFNMGTSGSPIPSTSTAKLEIVCTSNVQFGFEIRSGATVNTQGNVITNRAFLAADAAAAATSLTTDVSTGWKNGDVIALAATTRTRAECESKALTADASGTSLTITGLTNAHSGTAPIAGELANLTRNVSVFSTSTANQTYVNIGAFAIVDFEATEFYNMGSATALKRGIDVATTTGSFTINNCSIHDFNVAGGIALNLNSATNNNITVSNLVFYNSVGNGIVTTASSGAANTMTNALGIFTGAAVFSFGDLGTTISNITAVGGTTRGVLFGGATTAASNIDTISGVIAHSNTGPGIDFSNATVYGNNPFGTISNIASWRNTTYGIAFGNTFGFIVDGAGSNNGALFGSTTANIGFTGSCANIYVRNMVSNAGTTLTCPLGIAFTNDMKDAYIDNSTFGATTTHATGDMSVTGANIFTKFFARNCTFNSPTILANQNANMVEGGEISSARHQQTAGNHRSFKKFGTISPDTVIFHNSTASTRLTPNTANQKIQSGYKKAAIPNGQTAVINVWVRKSVAGDGTTYNGNQPRLIQRADAATGNNTDTVLATATNAANGAWQLLQATTAAVNDNCAITLYVDCDGTTGWVNVTDWSVQ